MVAKNGKSLPYSCVGKNVLTHYDFISKNAQHLHGENLRFHNLIDLNKWKMQKFFICTRCEGELTLQPDYGISILGLHLVMIEGSFFCGFAIERQHEFVRCDFFER